MPLKEEELYTALILGGIAAIYIVPMIILYYFHAGPWEYFFALSIFMIFGVIFWHAGAVLRKD
jgi:hypothetical protein